MKIEYPVAGKYVVAVSGGVDSVVLLHALVMHNSQFAIHNNFSMDNGQLMKNEKSEMEKSPYQLIVAHVDHGWREDSADDERFVRAVAEQYGLPYESTRLKSHAHNEATARAARWEFLHSIRDRYSASAILTAHHRGDVLETMLINLRRGTGRSGLTSLKNTLSIQRPLLSSTKAEIVEYATTRRLEFMQDSTNLDRRYLRNRVRYQLHTADDTYKQQLWNVYTRMLSVNQDIDTLLNELIHDHCLIKTTSLQIPRTWFQALPASIQKETLRAAILIIQPSAELNSEQITRGVAGITNALAGKITELGGRIELQHSREKTTLTQISTQRMKLLKYRDREGD